MCKNFKWVKCKTNKYLISDYFSRSPVDPVMFSMCITCLFNIHRTKFASSNDEMYVNGGQLNHTPYIQHTFKTRLYGVCQLTNLVYVISACWWYLCFSPFSSSLTRFIICAALLSVPPLYEQKKKKKAQERGCQLLLHVAAQLTGREKEESKERWRRTERRGDEMLFEREREEWE